MPIGLLKDIAKEYPKGHRLMGLDLGSKTIGVSVSDSDLTVASAIKTIKRKKFSSDIQELKIIFNDYEIGGVVMGWPLNIDGSHSPRCDATRSFADELSKFPEIFGKNLWIAFWDERLSTSAVEDFLVNDVDMPRSKRERIVDKMAAQIILQGAIDYLKIMVDIRSGG
jgi:putative Holliday junction resolvase